ncbi:radical SAM protein [bacterium]|nr:radical SAM protein [bacterium]
MNYKHLFGPVISRRLGISLGVDVVPYKYCSMNCVYCEVGQTTHLINEPEELVDLPDVIKELNEYIEKNPKLDYITFSGAGEPLLYSKIGDLINYIKAKYPQYKLALITNSSHIHRADIREELLKLDMIMPSLDAVDQDIFEAINRPHEDISIKDIIKNLIEFNQHFPGEMWLEIFFVPGINDSQDELTRMREVIKEITPERVQLNSLDRPGTEPWVVQEDKEKLEEIKSFFQADLSDNILVEIIKKVDKKLYDENPGSLEVEEKIISTIRRRPCTAQDMSQMLNVHINAINKVLHKLIEEKKIEGAHQERGIFYKLINQS